MSERFYVPAGFGQAEFIEKKSRFIGRVWPVETEAAALQHIKDMREKHWDASHNVYVYKIRQGNIMRYSDDGEPQGTSGVPALNVFISEKIENFCCVVTRYFGGTLLGTGGLTRAYSHTAKLALESAGISVMDTWSRLRFACPYARFERVKTLCEEMEGITEDTDYGAEIVLTVLFPAEKADIFSDALFDRTQGTVRTETLGQELRAIKVR